MIDEDDEDDDNGGNSPMRTPCAVDRNGPEAMTDAAPGPGSYVSAYDIVRHSSEHTKNIRHADRDPSRSCR